MLRFRALSFESITTMYAAREWSLTPSTTTVLKGAAVQALQKKRCHFRTGPPFVEKPIITASAASEAGQSTHLPRLRLPAVRGLEGHLELSRAGGEEVGGLVLVAECVPAHHDGLGPPCREK